MVKDMKKKKWLKYMCIVSLLLIFSAVFFLWLRIGNENLTIFEFYRKIMANAVLTETAQNGAILQLLPYFLIFPLAASCLSGVKAVFLILGIRSNLLGKTIYGAEVEDIFDMLHREMKKTIILVTHNLDFANKSEKKYSIQNGRLVRQ